MRECARVSVPSFKPIRGDVNRSFRLGTTSFIHRAGWLENATRLASLVEDVELLCFDGDPSALPSDEEVAGLAALSARTGLTYSLHTPLEASLASEDERRRRDGVQRVLRVVDRTRPLAPHAVVVHVYLGDREGDPLASDLAGFRRRAARSLSEIVQAGVAREALCAESLDYDFELIAPVIEDLGLRFQEGVASVAPQEVVVGTLRPGTGNCYPVSTHRAAPLMIRSRGRPP